MLNITEERLLSTISNSLLFGMAALVFGIISLCFLKSYLKLGTGLSALVAIVSLIGGAATGLITFAQGNGFKPHVSPMDQEYLWTVSTGRGFLIFFALPFLIRLYCLWTNPRERLPGAVQARGWLRLLDWAYALFIAGCAHLGFGIPLLLSVVALALIILLPQLVNTLMNQPTSPSSSLPPENLSAERAKVLSLLEQGKITVEESADLLAALGAAKNVPAAATAPHNLSRRLMVIGAVFIVAGFFLPWFSINPLREMERLTSQFSNMMGASEAFSVNPSMSRQTFFGTIHVSGPKIGKGLGWMILFLGLAAAAIPFCFPNPQQGMFSLVPLAVGAFMLLYLCSEAFRSINIGFLVVVAGYALEIAGSLRLSQSQRFVTATPQRGLA